MSRRIIGADLGLNHFAIVTLSEDSFRPAEVYYATTVKKHLVAKPPLEHDGADWGSFLLPKKAKGELAESLNARRRSKLYELFDHILPGGQMKGPYSGDVYINIEHYSYGSQSASIYEMGEMGGLFRHICYERGFYIRQTAPMSLKLFVGAGNYGKPEMIEAAMSIHGGYGIIKPGHLPIDCTEWGDIIDAWWLAVMLKTELDVRAGKPLTELAENVVRTFNRVTKKFPVNLLARDFLGK